MFSLLRWLYCTPCLLWVLALLVCNLYFFPKLFANCFEIFSSSVFAHYLYHDTMHPFLHYLFVLIFSNVSIIYHFKFILKKGIVYHVHMLYILTNIAHICSVYRSKYESISIRILVCQFQMDWIQLFWFVQTIII